MRHLKSGSKLGRKADHRNAMLANLAASIIKHKRVITTISKAKAVRPVVEKLITLGRHAIGASQADNVHLRRLAAAKLRQQPRSHFKGTPTQKGAVLRKEWRENHDVVHILFDKIAPVFKDRPGGYTRIVRIGQRPGDASMEAILELVELPTAAVAETAPVAAATAAK